MCYDISNNAMRSERAVNMQMAIAAASMADLLAAEKAEKARSAAAANALAAYNERKAKPKGLLSRWFH